MNSLVKVTKEGNIGQLCPGKRVRMARHMRSSHVMLAYRVQETAKFLGPYKRKMMAFLINATLSGLVHCNPKSIFCAKIILGDFSHVPNC